MRSRKILLTELQRCKAEHAQIEKPLSAYTVVEVSQLLAQLGLDAHVEKFASDLIDGSTLELVGDNELQELGMSAEERLQLLAESKRRRKACAELSPEHWIEVLGRSVGKDIPWDQLQSTLAPAAGVAHSCCTSCISDACNLQITV